MQSNLETAFFAGNRQKLRTLIKTDAPIVITAAGQLQKSADTTYPFRQDSNFWYLTGINEPDVVLVIEHDNEYLILPPRNDTQVLFDGPVERTQLSKISGIQSIYDEAEGWERLQRIVTSTKNVATVAAPPSYIDTYGFYTNPARLRLSERLTKQLKLRKHIDIRPQLTELRAVKQAPELATITSAVAATLDVLAALGAELPTMTNEHQVAAFITYEFSKRQLTHGYEPIVASGLNGCTVHYVANNSPIDTSSYLLVDAGAQVDYYTADITRVLHPTTASPRQQAVKSAVEQVQAYAMSLLKPGVLLVDYEKSVEQFMGKQLKQLKLITTTDRDSIREYFPYLTSHFLGIDVHDVWDRDKPLEPGMVLTVEPGIHIPAERIAVRIEDDVVVTDTGVEMLGIKR
jgi:Xaa-Pro aminopeptidase